ncbi:MAG: beta-glucosidase [Deltaproteobacteria bacterium]|nr:beta-glucosidase [Deltaproteobacteria bacterium]
MSMQFPSQMLWGAATAAFQVEGAANSDGKGPSIWDVYCDTPGKTVAGDTGRVACDHYHRWREDLALMRELNLRAYRFSVSWPRVMPTGRGTVNAPGLDFYDRLVDALRAAEIEPFVTLFHWDLPAALQMELGGWAHPDSAAIFADYAETVFDRLGDRVRFWMTLNEPWVVVDAGYFHGVHAPGIKDRALGYRAGHNLLRAHAYAVERFRALHNPDAKISFALNTSYSFPASERVEDVAAAERALLSFGGWFGDPVWFGDYPAVMRERLGSLLPVFSDQDAKLLTRSIDYIALNYYTSEVVRHAAGANAMETEIVPQPEVVHTSMNWPVRADGFEKLLVWLSERYGGLPAYVTENGAAFEDQADAAGFVQDDNRIRYLYDHFAAARRAMKSGVDLRGYLVWSLLDNLEWSAGFSKRFGLIRCDHATQKRTIKASGRWYADGIANNQFALAASGVLRAGERA